MEENLTENGRKCFLLFTKPNPIFIESLRENDILFTLGSQIIADPNTSDSLISRLSSIFLCLFEACPDQCAESTGFLFNLLRFIENTGVFDLFKSICCKDSELKAIQQYLVESKLHIYIVQMLDSTQKVDQTFKNLLSLISYGANNKNMWHSFCCDEICQSLVKTLKSLQEIPNEGWQAIDAVTCNKSIHILRPFINDAITLLSTSYLSPKPALTFAVEFLQKMIRKTESDFPKPIVNQIISSIISLIASVPDSSNLMGSVFRLIGSLVRSKNIREQALNSFLPIITAEAPSRVRSAATAQCATFILHLQEAAALDPELNAIVQKSEEYQEICERFIPWYHKKLTSNYGGSSLSMDRLGLISNF